jgi:hypothetical protein
MGTKRGVSEAWANGVKGLEVWRDLFVEELRQRLAGSGLSAALDRAELRNCL